MIPFQRLRSSEHGAAAANGIGSSCRCFRSDMTRFLAAGLKVAIFFSGNAEDALEKARGLAKALAAATFQAVKWGERVIWL